MPSHTEQRAILISKQTPAPRTVATHGRALCHSMPAYLADAWAGEAGCRARLATAGACWRARVLKAFAPRPRDLDPLACPAEHRRTVARRGRRHHSECHSSTRVPWGGHAKRSTACQCCPQRQPSATTQRMPRAATHPARLLLLLPNGHGVVPCHAIISAIMRRTTSGLDEARFCDSGYPPAPAANATALYAFGAGRREVGNEGGRPARASQWVSETWSFCFALT